jgi:hypothetical protein
MHATLASFLADRRFLKGSTIWTILILIAVNAPVVWYRDRTLRLAGIERAATGILANDPETAGRPVRYDWSIGADTARYLPYIPDARRQPLVILSGMSQMYAINSYKPGDKTISEWLDDRVAPRGARVFGLAAPNLSHEEALFLLVTSSRDPKTKPATFIFAVAFEKLREADLRPTYRALLRSRPDVIDEWRRVANENAASYPRAAKKMLATLDDLEEPSEATFEHNVGDRLAARIPVLKERITLNSAARGTIYDFRNWIFGIDNTTKRPLIRERYDVNREFLGILAQAARERDVQLILYIVPFNPHADSPYIPEEYEAFKIWMREFCAKENIPLANLENVVPFEDWGTFLGGPDFKHFKNEGHRKTAAAIERELGGHLLRKPGAPR